MSSIVHDQDARDAALDIEQSFIVQAPAGSGKTELLTQRILKLLAHAEEPEAILAITFTRKAASEMRARILKSLNKAKRLQEQYSSQELSDYLKQQEKHEFNTLKLSLAALAQDERLAWNLLENPNRLQLKTIDSFCSGIVFQLPLLAELGGQVSINENAELLYRHASRSFLATLEEDKPWSQSLARVLTYLDKRSEQIEDMLISLLARRPQWISLVLEFSKTIREHSHETLKSHMETGIQDIIESHFTHLKNADGFQLLHQLDELIPFCSVNAVDNPSINSLKDCPNIQKLEFKHLKHWKNICGLLLTNEGTLRKPGGVNTKIGFPAGGDTETKTKKKQFQSLLQELEPFPELIKYLQSIRGLPSQSISKEQLKISAEICECLSILLAYLKLSFQEHHAVDFNEIQLRANFVLNPDFDNLEQEGKPALLAIDTKIKHILIDEYQDTSNSQLKLLENLVSQWQYQQEGKTLFLVGDPMQSIYRFREANVGIFIQAQENGVKNIKLQKLSLTSNFRSNTEIVNWVNDNFSLSFPKKNDYRIGAVTYSTSQAFRQNKSTMPSVEYHITEIELESEYRTSVQAEQIVGKIQSIKKVAEDESIAILVRSKSHSRSIISRLKEQGISYQGLDMDPLSECPHIINLMNLSSALLHLGDQIAWYGLLRSALLGLNNSDLLALSQACQTKDLPIGLLLTSENSFPNLSTEAINILNRCLPHITAAINDLERKPFSFVLESCWLALGGPASIEIQQTLDCANFFNLLRKLESENSTLNSQSIHEACEKLFAEPQNDGVNPVFIMSIHKSKGLEFDHVFLPSLEKSTRGDDKNLLNWDVHQNKKGAEFLLLAPLLPSHIHNDETLLYDYLEQLEKEKVKNENIRLFYVAATRAKNNLYLYASIKQKLDKKTGEITHADPASNSLLSLIWDNIKDDEGKINYHLNKNSKAGVSNKNPQDYQLKRIAHDWENIAIFQAEENPPMHQEHHLSENRIENILAAPNSASLIGVLVHACLKQFTESDRTKKENNWIAPQNLKHYHPMWVKMIQNEGVLENDLIKEIIASCENILKVSLTDKKNAWIFDNELEQSQCEQDIFYAANNAQSLDDYKHLIVDRSFIKDGVRWIVDYKTTEPKTGQNFEEFLSTQEKEHRAQLESYALCYQALESLPQQLALYFPKIAQLFLLKK